MSLFTGAAAIAAAVAAAGGATAAAKMSSNATTKGAKLQTDAANRAAELQKQASDETIAFERQKDAEDRARAEVDRRANYDQYTSRYRAAQNLGHAFGFDLGDAPAYVPGEPTSSAGAPAGTAPSGSAASGNAMDPNYIAQQVTSELAKYGQKPGPRGSGPGDVAAWVDYIRAGKGWEPYWQTRIGQAFQPGGFKPNAPQANTAASLLLPHTAAPMQAVGPKTNTIRDYLATRI